MIVYPGSREQNYRPKDCGICHAPLTMRPGKGFWEGGEGAYEFLSCYHKDLLGFRLVRASSRGRNALRMSFSRTDCFNPGLGIMPVKAPRPFKHMASKLLSWVAMPSRVMDVSVLVWRRGRSLR